MKRLVLVAAITSLLATMASNSWASANLNLSKSNINKVIYSTNAMTSTQAAALVAKFDKMPRVDEAAVRKALKELNINNTNFKLIRIIPGKPPTVLLLTNPKDEAEARKIAVNDPGMPPERPPIKSK
jgi:hypothetical protein